MKSFKLMKSLKRIQKALRIDEIISKIYRFNMHKDFCWNSPGIQSYLFLRNYYFYHKFKIVPFKQVTAYESLVRFKSICDDLNVSIYAAHGTLLGAIRSNSFAGRPKDLDFYVTSSDMDKVIKGLDRFSTMAIKPHRCKIHKAVFQFMPNRGVPISLVVYKLCTANRSLYERDTKYFINNYDAIRNIPLIIYDKEFTQRVYKDSKNQIVFSNIILSDKEEKIFDVNIKVPNNYLDLLSLQYDDNWSVPTGKQFGRIVTGL